MPPEEPEVLGDYDTLQEAVDRAGRGGGDITYQVVNDQGWSCGGRKMQVSKIGGAWGFCRLFGEQTAHFPGRATRRG
jgi:hypothetical protein